MTAAERVQALGTVVINAGCGCNTCGAARARLESAFLVCEREVAQRAFETAYAAFCKQGGVLRCPGP